MTKSEELEDPNSTWNKAGENEPLFILRGQDLTAPKVVLEWIKLNCDNCDPAKLRDAYKAVQAMLDTPHRKQAD